MRITRDWGRSPVDATPVLSGRRSPTITHEKRRLPNRIRQPAFARYGTCEGRRFYDRLAIT
jgi:hypothetical protein